MPASLEWLAGVLEGEGTIRINKATRRNLCHLVVSIVNTDREMVDAFAERWPSSARSVKLRKKHDGRRQAFVWVASSAIAAEVLNDLAPYLRTARVQRKALLALAFQRQKTRSHRNRSPLYREVQQRYYDVMLELNQRGERGHGENS